MNDVEACLSGVTLERFCLLEEEDAMVKAQRTYPPPLTPSTDLQPTRPLAKELMMHTQNKKHTQLEAHLMSNNPKLMNIICFVTTELSHTSLLTDMPNN